MPKKKRPGARGIRLKFRLSHPAGASHPDLTRALDAAGEAIREAIVADATPKARGRLIRRFSKIYRELIRERLRRVFEEWQIPWDVRRHFPGITLSNAITGKTVIIVKPGYRTGREQFELWAENVFKQLMKERIEGF